MSILGERLRQIRTEKGLSLDTVDNQTGISASLLSKYELGKRTPSKQRLEFLANYYNVSVDWLLGRIDDKSNEIMIINKIFTVSEPKLPQKYFTVEQLKMIQDIFQNLPDVPQEDLPLVADLVKRLAEKPRQVEKPRQPVTLAAHGGEIKNKQAVMRYIERRRREAEAKRKQQEGEPDATE